MPHLLIYSDLSDSGGIAQINHELVCALLNQGYRVTTILNRSESVFLAEQLALGAEQLWFAFDVNSDFDRTLQNDNETRQFMSQVSPDAVVFTDKNPLSSLAAKRSAVRMGIPYIILESSAEPELAASNGGALQVLGAIYAISRCVIAASPSDLATLRANFNLPTVKGRTFDSPRVIDEMLVIVRHAASTLHDYVTPGFGVVRPDRAFPNMAIGDASNNAYPYMRREIPHVFYCDRRQPTIGFVSRDEASILYNSARLFMGKPALEIGCWLGWSACHLAMGGVILDVIDPLLTQAEIIKSVQESLGAAGIMDRVRLVPGYSPAKVSELAAPHNLRWNLIFIDGDHGHPGPLNDSIACEACAQDDALVLFHDLASPDVGHGLEYFRSKGWNTMVYQTMQIMGVAWRGNVQPVKHVPDPAITWELPDHLRSFAVSGCDGNA